MLRLGRAPPPESVPSRTVTDTADDPGTAVRYTPTRDQLEAWRSFLRAHAAVTRVLEAELDDEQDLSLAAYDVLVQLAESPDGRLRMTELADAVLLSRSGVTRLVDRMERVGLVTRAPVQGDGRGVAATITDAGVDRLRAASRTHLAGVQRHFVARIPAEDLTTLERISRLLAG
jgi:DNA-binding MarR family transcriptional regulator